MILPASTLSIRNANVYNWAIYTGKYYLSNGAGWVTCVSVAGMNNVGQTAWEVDTQSSQALGLSRLFTSSGAYLGAWENGTLNIAQAPTQRDVDNANYLQSDIAWAQNGFPGGLGKVPRPILKGALRSVQSSRHTSASTVANWNSFITGTAKWVAGVVAVAAAGACIASGACEVAGAALAVAAGAVGIVEGGFQTYEGATGLATPANQVGGGPSPNGGDPFGGTQVTPIGVPVPPPPPHYTVTTTTVTVCDDVACYPETMIVYTLVQ
jgi:hypothetical protein